ncbi:hypothetical protein DFH06DRAFT_1125082 [Mycena polygramma]|nr:hypothetical protein DFH06DRAFT_1125082 [Mycena polygramma]
MASGTGAGSGGGAVRGTGSGGGYTHRRGRVTAPKTVQFASRRSQASPPRMASGTGARYGRCGGRRWLHASPRAVNSAKDSAVRDKRAGATRGGLTRIMVQEQGKCKRNAGRLRGIGGNRRRYDEREDQKESICEEQGPVGPIGGGTRRGGRREMHLVHGPAQAEGAPAVGARTEPRSAALRARFGSSLPFQCLLMQAEFGAKQWKRLEPRSGKRAGPQVLEVHESLGTHISWVLSASGCTVICHGDLELHPHRL